MMEGRKGETTFIWMGKRQRDTERSIIPTGAWIERRTEHRAGEILTKVCWVVKDRSSFGKKPHFH